MSADKTEGLPDTGDSVEMAVEASETTIPSKEQFAMSGPRGLPQARHDAQFQMFMNPMFAEMEARVKEQEAILDQINEKMQAEKEERVKQRQQAHIPEPLKGSGKDMSTVMKKVEDLMLYEINEEEEKQEEKQEEKLTFADFFKPPETKEDENKDLKVVEKKPVKVRSLDDHGHASVTAHSLAAFVSNLNETHLKRFTTKITMDCQLWLSKMFRFDEASIYYHEEPKDGLVRVCRLALYQKYPKYVLEGFEALYSRPPVIYLSSAAQPGLGPYLCVQLGLPMSSICVVPCNTLFGASSKMEPNKHHKMDKEILDKLIQDDIAAAKTPVLIVAYAGTPTMGHVDDLDDIKDICKKHDIWMHVEGNNLATLGCLQPPTDISDARFCDSLTLCMGKWLGIPAVPYVTMFKASDPSLVHAAALNTFNPALKLNCLPLWVILQTLGIEGIESRIRTAHDLSDRLFEKLGKIKCMKQLSREVKKDDRAIRSFGDLFSKAISALLIFDMANPTVVFKYFDVEQETSGVPVAPYAMGMEEDEDDGIDKRKKHAYFSSLNSWLAETLQAENPQMGISVIEIEREGVCMKFDPLDTAQVLGTSEDDVDALIKSLKDNIAILDATVLNFEKFRMIVTDQENLRVVELANWAGLGAVQYIPSEYKDHPDDLTPQAVQEVNNLNIELVHSLKAKDMAFSLGYTEMEMACVKFGLITEDTDVEELIVMVQTTGKEVQESSKYLETLSEAIKKGIEEANKDLVIENQHKIMEEGVLRQIPMIGSVMNWWSPPPKNVMKGRTFNLVSGTIASTEETYKYKMQIQTAQYNQKVSPRSRQVSESSSSTGVVMGRKPSDTRSPELPPSPQTKTAGDVKSKLLNFTNEGDLVEGQESLPSPNGNLRLDLEGPDMDTQATS